MLTSEALSPCPGAQAHVSIMNSLRSDQLAGVADRKCVPLDLDELLMKVVSTTQLGYTDQHYWFFMTLDKV